MDAFTLIFRALFCFFVFTYSISYVFQIDVAFKTTRVRNRPSMDADIHGVKEANKTELRI